MRVQVALFSENGARWLVADQGIMMVGGARAAVSERVPLANIAAKAMHASPVPFGSDGEVLCCFWTGDTELRALLPADAACGSHQPARRAGAYPAELFGGDVNTQEVKQPCVSSLHGDAHSRVPAAADAVRGSTSPPDELAYILRQSGAAAVICQDSQALEKLLPALALYDAQHAAGSSGAGASGAGANGASANGATANGASAAAVGGDSAAPGVRPHRVCRLFQGFCLPLPIQSCK